MEIRLLGPFEVVAGGTHAEVGGSKRQALLAMLALGRGRMVDVHALVEGLWGEARRGHGQRLGRDALLHVELGDDGVGGARP